MTSEPADPDAGSGGDRGVHYRGVDEGLELRLLTRRPRPDVLVIEIAGVLDMMTAPGVTDHVRAEVAEHRPAHLVLDLAAVSFLSSHGVAMIVTADNESPPATTLHLVGVAASRPVTRVLQITGLADTFADHATTDDLLRELDNHA